MKILINISNSKIEELAMEAYPELLRSEHCCNGFECGCNGQSELYSEKAVEQFEKDLIEDSDCFIEFMSEYEESYKMAEVFND